jgi:large subunit ribosomal protein L2
MAIKFYKTTRAARKKMSIVDRRDIHAGKPHKQLLLPATRTSGRGSEGKITIRHRGGGVKRRLRLVENGQPKLNIPAKVEQVEYDPNRSAYLALIVYADGVRSYVLAWEGAKPGDVVVAGEKAPEKPGNRLPLSAITPGTFVFNIEMQPGRGGKLLRSAGSYGVLMDTNERYAQVKMASSEVRLIPKDSYATIGQVSNPDWRHQTIGSAGRKRRMGWRPSVTGKSMNPVDHPHGGGEGHQPIGLKYPKTPWGKHALGVKTRRAGKYSDAFIISRRQKKVRKK